MVERPKIYQKTYRHSLLTKFKSKTFFNERNSGSFKLILYLDNHERHLILHTCVQTLHRNLLVLSFFYRKFDWARSRCEEFSQQQTRQREKELRNFVFLYHYKVKRGFSNDMEMGGNRRMKK